MSPEMSDDEKARELLIKFGVKPDELEQILVAAKTSKGNCPNSLMMKSSKLPMKLHQR